MAQNEMTLVSRLRDLKRSHPQMEAFISYDEAMVRSSVTTEEFYSLCAKFAYLLKQDGVLPGDYVACTIPLSLESTIITYGIIFAGAIPASLELTFVDGVALMQCMNHLKCRHLIIQDEPWSEVLKFCKEKFEFSYHPNSIISDVTTSQIATLERLMFVKRSGGRDQSFIELLRRSHEEYTYNGITRESVGWFCFTTGSEKEYLRMTEYSHASLLWICDSMNEIDKGPSTKSLYTNPYHWLGSIPNDIFYGCTRVFPDKWRQIKDVPLMLMRVITTEGIGRANIQGIYIPSMLKLLDQFSGGEPLLDILSINGMPVTRSFLQAISPLCKRFSVTYGNHELGPVCSRTITTEELQDYQDYDNGPIFPGAQVRLVDKDGCDVAPGEPGLVMMKTPGCFRGYCGQPDKTAARFNKDNWFVTFDRARLDPKNGHLFIGGRIDAVIIHGQYMLFPAWLEEFVAPHPAVKKVVVVPIQDVILFHAIGMAIQLHDGASMTKEEAYEMINKHFIPEKQSLAQIKTTVFVDSFPLKPDGSLDRPQLSDMLTNMVDGAKL